MISIREIAIYVCIMGVLLTMIGLDLRERHQDDAFIADFGVFEARVNALSADFERHSLLMEKFLTGWEKYDHIVENAELRLEKLNAIGEMPPVSCETVFVRQHVVGSKLGE